VRPPVLHEGIARPQGDRATIKLAGDLAGNHEDDVDGVHAMKARRTVLADSSVRPADVTISAFRPGLSDQLDSGGNVLRKTLMPPGAGR